jgi:hypothetical protein
MDAMYDRQHVDSVLERVGVEKDQRDEILNEIDFPIEFHALQALLAPYGITHDALVNRMGGSP